MGIAFTAKVIDHNDDIVAQFDLSNYRAYRCFLRDEDDYAGRREMEVKETLTILKEVREKFDQNYPREHHGPKTCDFLEKYIQNFSPTKVIIEWG